MKKTVVAALVLPAMVLRGDILARATIPGRTRATGGVA